jgi:hypothetical protein
MKAGRKPHVRVACERQLDSRLVSVGHWIAFGFLMEREVAPPVWQESHRVSLPVYQSSQANDAESCTGKESVPGFGLVPRAFFDHGKQQPVAPKKANVLPIGIAGKEDNG